MLTVNNYYYYPIYDLYNNALVLIQYHMFSAEKYIVAFNFPSI